MEAVTGLFGWIIDLVKVVIGLGFVIFIHELGHFLAAKWNNVKVEKFFLGFDFFGTRIWSFKYGETEYGIGGIPLGGYVKMLGEEANENGEKSTDPRAFNNKSAGARIVILSAGVVMNIILGVVIFTACQMIGVREIPAKIGRVIPGSPAYDAGLRSGDEIVSIDGRTDVHYNRMRLKVSLSRSGQILDFGVKRPHVEDVLHLPIEAKRQGKAGMPTIGVTSAEGLNFYKDVQWIEPSGMEGTAPAKDSLPPMGTIVAAGPKGSSLVPVKSAFELQQILYDNRDKPIDVQVESSAEEKGPKTTTTATIPVNHVVDFGLRMTPGTVKAIQPGSPADKAGIKVGDRIVSFDGHDDYDPMKLGDDAFGQADKATKLTVERANAGKPERVELTVTPNALRPYYLTAQALTDLLEPLDIPALGLAVDVEPKVAAVAENSPAAKAGIAPGAVISQITFPPLKKLDGTADPKAKPKVVDLGAMPEKPEKSVSYAQWPGAFWMFQSVPLEDVTITLKDNAKPIKLRAERDPRWFNPDRGLQTMQDIRDVPPQPFGAALKRGTDETYDNVVSIYAMIRSLFVGRVSTSNLAGLPRIVDIATQAAKAGFVTLLGFLGVLSVNLAVLNFLPIPPLDGGQIAFIIAEKVRGKPLKDSTLNVLLIGGLVLVLSLMAFTIIQDVILLVLGKG